MGIPESSAVTVLSPVSKRKWMRVGKTKKRGELECPKSELMLETLPGNLTRVKVKYIHMKVSEHQQNNTIRPGLFLLKKGKIFIVIVLS